MCMRAYVCVRGFFVVCLCVVVFCFVFFNVHIQSKLL